MELQSSKGMSNAWLVNIWIRKYAKSKAQYLFVNISLHNWHTVKYNPFNLLSWLNLLPVIIRCCVV